MGEVWRAHDANLDREVAIKLLNPGALADQTSRDRFRREAHVLSRLSHPGVATIYDFDSQGGVDFLVMELVTGGTLESRIARARSPRPTSRASAHRSLTHWRTPTPAASSTATSRPATSSSPTRPVTTPNGAASRITALFRFSLGPAPR
jgi:serine/threonine protein kinase